MNHLEGDGGFNVEEIDPSLNLSEDKRNMYGEIFFSSLLILIQKVETVHFG